MSYTNAWQRQSYTEPEPNSLVESTARSEITARSPSPAVQQAGPAATWLPVNETDVTLDTFGNVIYENNSPSGHLDHSSRDRADGGPSAVIHEVGPYAGAYTWAAARARSLDLGAPAQAARGQAGYVTTDQQLKTETVNNGQATSSGLPTMEALTRGFNSYDQNNSYKRSPHETFVYDNRKMYQPERRHYPKQLFPNAAVTGTDLPANVPDAAGTTGLVYSAFQRLTGPQQRNTTRRVPVSPVDITEASSAAVAYGAPVATDPQSYSESGIAWVIA